MMPQHGDLFDDLSVAAATVPREGFAADEELASWYMFLKYANIDTWCVCTPPVFLSTHTTSGRPNIRLPLTVPSSESRSSSLPSSVKCMYSVLHVVVGQGQRLHAPSGVPPCCPQFTLPGLFLSAPPSCPDVRCVPFSQPQYIIRHLLCERP